MPNREHPKYPYLLRRLPITRPNQVWASDITYVRLQRGFVYLTAIMDWFSRYVIAWELSTTLDSDFCVRAWKGPWRRPSPRFSTPIKACSTRAQDFTKVLLAADVRISMNGAGRCFDNIMVERLWRTVKQEEVYLKDYEDVLDCRGNLGEFFPYYNTAGGTAVWRAGPRRFTWGQIDRRKYFFAALGLCPRPRDFLRHDKKVSCGSEGGVVS